MRATKTVTILQHRLLHYRVDFFERLRGACAANGITLNLVHGQASKAEKVRDDEGALPWARVVENRYIRVANRDLLWQPLPRDLRRPDLLVIMQENRILSNYQWLLNHHNLTFPLAYWGHGVNFQSRAPNGLRERWKRWLIARVDWWFAYTRITADLVHATGFPSSRISCLNNAVDTGAFVRDLQLVSSEIKQRWRNEFDIEETDRIAVFCGSLYPDKRLELMIESGDLLIRKFPNYRLIVIGDGPSAAMLREKAKHRAWLKMAGVRRGAEKAAIFSLASVMLNPGLLGLHILDAFAAGLPLISTADAPHSPEVAYLEDGKNGALVANDPRAYADCVAQVFEDQAYASRLAAGARTAAALYTVDGMVDAFLNGIQGCLEAGRRC